MANHITLFTKLSFSLRRKSAESKKPDLKAMFKNVAHIPMTTQTSIRVSKEASMLMGKGDCKIIFCQSCLIEANKMMSSNGGNDAGRRTSSRGMRPSNKMMSSNLGTSKVSSSPRIEDLPCPCLNSSCGKISDFESAHNVESFGVYKASSSGSFKTFCCSQPLVFNKNASKS